jgi:dienelactone hydrolase
VESKPRRCCLFAGNVVDGLIEPGDRCHVKMCRLQPWIKATSVAVCTLATMATLALTMMAQAGPALAASPYGPFGPEGSRMREQFWILPSGDSSRVLRATVFRPDEAQHTPQHRHPVVVINHGTSESTRLAVAMPVYYWLSRWFVERGYVVVLPQRRGHGATGGVLSEAIGNCANPDHYRSGLAAAEDISAVVSYLQEQPFVDPDNIVVTGISTGGWASLAYASRNPKGVRAIINFSGGRGGHAGGLRNAVCAEKRLIESAGHFAQDARVPTAWFYSGNDSYFGPQLARAMARAWNGAGGLAELHVLPPYGEEGHNIADDRAGWDVWGSELQRFLDMTSQPKVAARPQPTPLPSSEARAAHAAFKPGENQAVVGR